MHDAINLKRSEAASVNHITRRGRVPGAHGF